MEEIAKKKLTSCHGAWLRSPISEKGVMLRGLAYQLSMVLEHQARCIYVLRIYTKSMEGIQVARRVPFNRG